MNIDKFLGITIEVETDLQGDQFLLLDAGSVYIKTENKTYVLDSEIVASQQNVGDSWRIELKVQEMIFGSFDEGHDTQIISLQEIDLEKSEIEVFLGQDQLPEDCYFDIISSDIFYQIDSCAYAKEIKVDF